ncbi:MAG TPA: hypothetical protein VI233_07615, partial [Puia sp.]
MSLSDFDHFLKYFKGSAFAAAYISSFSSAGDSARFELLSKVRDEQFHFRIEIGDFVEFRVESANSGSIGYTRDHPLLWKYTEHLADLYFSGNIENPEKVWVDLENKHIELFGDLKPMSAFFNEGYWPAK